MRQSEEAERGASCEFELRICSRPVCCMSCSRDLGMQ